MLVSPKRRVLQECLPFYYPFGNTPAHNALEGLEMNPDQTGNNSDDTEGLNVLFLGCGDLRNPLTTSVGGGIVKHQVDQHIHINDASLSVIARNILIMKIISCPKFDPNKGDDMDYVWDIWYNATFTHSTTKRFTEDVESLLDSPLPTNITILKSSYLEELKSIWNEWLSKLRSSSVEQLLAERNQFMTRRWTVASNLQKGLMDLSLADTGSFSVVVNQATKRLEQYLVNDMLDKEAQSRAGSLKGKLVDEAKQYFETGICGSNKSAATSINPTLLQPITGKWLVHYASCPFEGYLPISWKVIDKGDHHHQDGAVLFRYCQGELKKLFVAFRERMEKIKFYFHPCDALALCYDDSFPKFDLIDTSNLADHVGMVNLLTAGAQKLRSNQSVLITESMLWINAGSSEALYLQEVLCCPLTLIPTIYGLRLIENVELGPETLQSIRTLSLSVSRLHWKRSLPFIGVELSLSPVLEKSLKYLRGKCFNTAIPSGPKKATGMESYSPLTFHYVLSDLIRRGGTPSALMTPSLLGLPPVFSKSIETSHAWMEQRPIWRVKVVMPFTSMDQALYDRIYGVGTPLLRLILLPVDGFLSSASVFLSLGAGAKSPIDKFLNTNSIENHFVDNIEVDLKLKSSGLVDQVDISFLLEDRSLLQTHCGLVIEQANSIPVFLIGLFSERQPEVELFRLPYPWNNPLGSSPVRSEKLQLVSESCLESEIDYNIRLKVQAEGTPLSGLKVKTDQRSPCDSAHRITVSLDGIKPLTLTLPYPILPNHLKATLRRKEGIVEISATKAIQVIWPEDCVRPVHLRWNPDELDLWESNENLAVHLGSQFNLDYLINPVGNKTDVFCQVRKIIRTIFTCATQNGDVLFQLQIKEANNDSPADWFIRAHPPARMSSRGTPVLLLSAIDHHKAEQLTDEGKIDRQRSLKEFQQVFTVPGLNGVRNIFLYSAEEARLIRYILQLNSTKIQPSSWQKKNLSLKEPSSWLTTFIRPLYRDGQLNIQDVIPTAACRNCLKTAAKLKRCSRCESVSYCSVECQKADWSSHKPSCVAKPKK